MAKALNIKDKKLKKPKKRTFILLVLAVMLIGSFLIAKLFTGPAVGTINTNVKQTAEGQENIYVFYDGQNMGFSYLEKMSLETGEIGRGNVLESYRLKARATSKDPSWLAAINVYKLDSSDLNQNSTYRVRQMNADEYKKNVEEIDGKQVSIFAKTDNSEKAAFFVSGSRLAAVSVSGVSLTETIDQVFNRIISSWEWK